MWKMVGRKIKLGDAKVWKGLQVTLPYEVLETTGAKPGDYVQFYKSGNLVYIEKA